MYRYVAAGDALSVTMQNALLGVGDAQRVAVISIGTQWLLFLPAAYVGVTKMVGLALFTTLLLCVKTPVDDSRHSPRN